MSLLLLCRKPQDENFGCRPLPIEIWQKAASYMSLREWAQACGCCKSMFRVPLVKVDLTSNDEYNPARGKPNDQRDDLARTMRVNSSPHLLVDNDGVQAFAGRCPAAWRCRSSISRKQVHGTSQAPLRALLRRCRGWQQIAQLCKCSLWSCSPVHLMNTASVIIRLLLLITKLTGSTLWHSSLQLADRGCVLLAAAPEILTHSQTFPILGI